MTAETKTIRVTDDGWTVTAYPEPNRPTVRVTCVSPERRRVLTRTHLTPQQADALDPRAEWARGAR